MRLCPLQVEGAHLIELEPHVDARGSFARSFCREQFVAHGLAPDFVQCNISRNIRCGTLRGLHYQREPHAEAKLMRCVRGRAHVVVLDLRRGAGSGAFGSWVGLEIEAEQGAAVYVPQGCASGFLTLADTTEIHYQMSASYAPAHACGVRWDDPRFAIEWPARPACISPNDASLPNFESP